MMEPVPMFNDPVAERADVVRTIANDLATCRDRAARTILIDAARAAIDSFTIPQQIEKTAFVKAIK